MRSGRQHDAPGAHLPQPFTRQLQIGRREMVADALEPGEKILRVIAEDLRARQQRDIGRRAEFGERGAKPFGGRLAIDARRFFGKQRAPHFGLFVEQHHPRAAARGGERGGEAGRSGADDGDVAMSVEIGIMIGVAFGRRAAKAGGAADQRLIKAFPGADRLHEGLVVKAGGNEGREQAVDRPQVEIERRPIVLADRIQPLVKFDLGCAQIRRETALPCADAHQRIGFVGTHAEKAARAMIFERASDQMHAIGEQRRGKRIAGKSAEFPTVEGEADRLAAIDAAAVGRAIVAHHEAAPAASAPAIAQSSASANLMLPPFRPARAGNLRAVEEKGKPVFGPAARQNKMIARKGRQMTWRSGQHFSF
jgi:hypothetical protein